MLSAQQGNIHALFVFVPYRGLRHDLLGRGDSIPKIDQVSTTAKAAVIERNNEPFIRVLGRNGNQQSLVLIIQKNVRALKRR